MASHLRIQYAVLHIIYIFFNINIYNIVASWDYSLMLLQVVTRTLHNSGFSGPVKEVSKQLYKDFAGPQNWEVFPDVHKALQQLRSKGAVLGAVSNFDERLGECLQ